MGQDKKQKTHHQVGLKIAKFCSIHNQKLAIELEIT
jgi:hypothetical protein